MCAGAGHQVGVNNGSSKGALQGVRVQHPYDDLFYDLEFLEDGYTISLISIGLVARDGRKYYAVSANLGEAAVTNHAWLRENVVPLLPRYPGIHMDGTGWHDRNHPDVKSRNQIADEVSEFIGAYKRPRLIGYYSDYDHVCLMQLWGPMVAKPAHVPMKTFDLAQLAEELGNPVLPKQTTPEHHALNDATWNMEAYDFLRDLESRAYIFVDSNHAYDDYDYAAHLICSECDSSLVEISHGVTLPQLNAAYRDHLDPEIPLGWEAEAA